MAKFLPNIRFYSYTKSLQFLKRYKKAEGIKDYTKSTFEAAKSNVELDKQAALAESRNRILLEQFDRQAEVQRQIRDDESKSFPERIAANEKLGELLKDQQSVRLKIGKMSMLTEALRSYVMRVAWEHDEKIHSTNAGLVMNFSTDTVQEVTELCMDIYDNSGAPMDRGVDKLVRDSFIWSHLAGDSVQRLKVAGRILR